MTRMKRISDAVRSIYYSEPYLWRLVIIMILWMIFMGITSFSKFYTLLNFQTMAAQFPEFGLMALGVMVCMITGGIDLSTVSIANLTSISVALCMVKIGGTAAEMPVSWVPVLFLPALLVGFITGALNGVLVAKLHIPPILATLGTSELLAGISTVMTNGKAVSEFPMTYAYSINSRLAGIPVQLIIFCIAAVIIWFLLTCTTYGKKLLLAGTSIKAAYYSGLEVNRILIRTYVISGICSALGGMLMLANYNSARADYGSNYILQCILIVVLGGVSPAGGKGKISGVIMAIVLVRMLETGINRFPAVSSYFISLIWGLVLILAMVLDYFAKNKMKMNKKVC